MDPTDQSRRMSAVREPVEGAAGTRRRILDATEQIMLDEGYAAVSSRKLAAKAGLKSNLMHYHFATMDELFIAAFQRRDDLHVTRLAHAASSDRPLRALWNLAIDAANNRLYLEFNALACHRPAVREHIARSNSRDRIGMTSALKSVLKEYGADEERFPASVLATVMAGIARGLATDKALGNDEGHRDTLAFVERLLDVFEPVAPEPPTSVDIQRDEEAPANRTRTKGGQNAFDHRA